MNNDSLLTMKACSFYNSYFEFLLDIRLEDASNIKSAWENELQGVMTGRIKSTKKDVDMKYYLQMVRVLDIVQRDYFGLYRGGVPMK